MGRNPSHRFVLKVEELRLSPELASDPTYCQALADVHPSPAAAPAAVPPASTSDTNSSSSNGSGRSSANGSSGSTVRLIQSHGDQVLRLPEGARPLAESETARFEVWAWGRHVLAIQVGEQWSRGKRASAQRCNLQGRMPGKCCEGALHCLPAFAGAVALGL